MPSSWGQRITPYQSLTSLGDSNPPSLSGTSNASFKVTQPHQTEKGKKSDLFPPSPMLHPQNNCTYPFPQANPGSSFTSFVQAQRIWESESGHQSLSHHMADYYFVQAPQIIRVIWLKVKELFIRNNSLTRYTLNLLTSLWSTGIHKVLVTNLQKIHSIGPRIQIKSWKTNVSLKIPS